MSDKHIKQLYEEVCNQLEGDYKIILEPGRNLTEKWIEYAIQLHRHRRNHWCGQDHFGLAYRQRFQRETCPRRV